MRAHSRRGRKGRRLTRKYGVLILVASCAVLASAVVVLLMYLLTSMNWRPRF